MDDLSSKLSELLSDPNIMEQVKGLSGMFGAANQSAPSPTAPPANNYADNNSQNFNMPDDTMNMIMKIMPLLSSINKEDENTALLRALRPLLGKSRQKKLDEAIKIMQMMKILPLLKNQGIF